MSRIIKCPKCGLIANLPDQFHRDRWECASCRYPIPVALIDETNKKVAALGGYDEFGSDEPVQPDDAPGTELPSLVPLAPTDIPIPKDAAASQRAWHPNAKARIPGSTASREEEADPNKRWMVANAGVEFGPFAANELIESMKSGALPPSILVRTEGMVDWKPVMELAFFRTAYYGVITTTRAPTEKTELKNQDKPPFYIPTIYIWLIALLVVSWSIQQFGRSEYFMRKIRRYDPVSAVQRDASHLIEPKIPAPSPSPTSSPAAQALAAVGTTESLGAMAKAADPLSKAMEDQVLQQNCRKMADLEKQAAACFARAAEISAPTPAPAPAVTLVTFTDRYVDYAEKAKKLESATAIEEYKKALQYLSERDSLALDSADYAAKGGYKNFVTNMAQNVIISQGDSPLGQRALKLLSAAATMK